MSITNASSSAFDIVGIGAATVDILSLVDQFPEHDSVQLAHATKLSGGGPVATALCAASKLGLKSALIDSIGDDWAGNRIIDDLEVSSVDTSFVTVTEGAISSLSTVLVRRSDASRAISFTPGSSVSPPLTPSAERAIAAARVLHINGRHVETCRSAIKVALEHRTLISFDGGAGRYRREIIDLLSASNFPIVSRDFATAATGITDSASAASELAKSPAAHLAIVTDGIRGSWLATQNSPPSHQAAFALHDTIDTTGAGDVFHGAFLASFLLGFSFLDAQRDASAAAALSTTSLGGRDAIPNPDAVAELLANHPIN